MKKICLIFILSLQVSIIYSQHIDYLDLKVWKSTYPIYFASGSDRPLKSSLRTIDTIEYLLWSHCDESLANIGYTDSTGSDELNNKLSLRRATAVLNLIQAVASQRNDTLSWWGFRHETGYYKTDIKNLVKIIAGGKSWPAASNATPAGRAKNRRVEAVFTPRLCELNKCGNDTLARGPNGELLIIPLRTYECGCVADETRFGAILNEAQLRDSANFTALTDDGAPLQSGGMLTIWNRYSDSCFTKCHGNVLLRLPKKFYYCNGMTFYYGATQNGKVVWHADNSKSFTSNGDYYDVWLNCNDIYRLRINCDKIKTCMCKDCRGVFGGFGLPDNDTYLLPVSNAGIVLQPGDTTKHPVIKDVTDECFYTINHISNIIDDKTYARYNFSFRIYINEKDDANGHQALGNGKVYLVRKVNESADAIRLYEFKTDANGNGNWAQNPIAPNDVYRDSGCVTYTFPVTETGVYMVTDTQMQLPQALRIKAKKRFKLIYGTTFTESPMQCPGIMLPVTKAGNKVIAQYTGDTQARIICIFEKGGQQYLLNKKLTDLPKTRNGKYYRIKRKVLEEQTTKDKTTELQDLCSKYFTGKGSCSCSKF